MADDSGLTLEQLREELWAAGYGAVVQEDALANQSEDRPAEAALNDLLDRLQMSVVTAMRAHAASIRNLAAARRSPGSQYWEPPPRRIALTPDEPVAEFVIEVDDDRAADIDAAARELERLLGELRRANAD